MEVLRRILDEAPPFCEIHVWAGFPCVDLSSAKAYRRNLAGARSSLIFEAIRVIDELKQLFPQKQIHFVVENVASMDTSARSSISSLLNVEPFKVDPSTQVPMFRPRLCWTSLSVPEDVRGVTMVRSPGYTNLVFEGRWPEPAAWLEEGAQKADPSVVYPTCMKSIPRNAAPQRPAGIERCSSSTLARWRSHDFRFPPYQYKEIFLIWSDRISQHRLLLPEEREALMGLGRDHTAVCFSASKAKTVTE